LAEFFHLLVFHESKHLHSPFFVMRNGGFSFEGFPLFLPLASSPPTFFSKAERLPLVAASSSPGGFPPPLFFFFFLASRSDHPPPFFRGRDSASSPFRRGFLYRPRASGPPCADLLIRRYGSGVAFWRGVCGVCGSLSIEGIFPRRSS